MLKAGICILDRFVTHVNMSTSHVTTTVHHQSILHPKHLITTVSDPLHWSPLSYWTPTITYTSSTTITPPSYQWLTTIKVNLNDEGWFTGTQKGWRGCKFWRDLRRCYEFWLGLTLLREGYLCLARVRGGWNPTTPPLFRHIACKDHKNVHI